MHTVDLTKPHLWYTQARGYGRKIIYHAGPTNSGKTFNALQVCMHSSYYRAPLCACVLEFHTSSSMVGHKRRSTISQHGALQPLRIAECHVR